MKLLIIGGTVFVGRALVEAAKPRGHEITLFNRGEHNPEIFPDVEKLRGDRDGGLDALRGREWDAVIDTCGCFPRVVRQSVRALSDAVRHYTFISSISVYGDFREPWDENGPLERIDASEAEAATTISGGNYGPLKVACEEVVANEFAGNSLIVRPGLIVGPHDPTDRFTYWPVRIGRGGDTLVPGSHEGRTQFIDVRDLAEWTIRAIERGRTGVYNTNGPDYPLTMQELFDTCKAVTKVDARPVYVPNEFLSEHDVEAGTVSFWSIPETEAQYRCVNRINSDKAIADGLTYRPLAETAGDTLAWANTRPSDYEWRAGLTPEFESRLLADWATRQP